MRFTLSIRLLIAAATLACAMPSYGVLLYATGDRNTDPPGSLSNRSPWIGPEGSGDPRALLNSGWQYEGEFRGFTGTPIASQYFITAKHIGGEGDGTNVFNWNGVSYPITTAGQYFDDPNSDLRIWKINGTFPANSWAPLYDASVNGPEYDSTTQTGKPMVVFGRGAPRGSAVVVNGKTAGWTWGGVDQVLSWGTNQTSGYADYATDGDNKLMAFSFDADGGPNEGALAIGDSGGGVFIQGADEQWKLAGVDYGADGPFAYNDDGSTFNASIFDANGLWVGPAGNQQLITDDVAGSSYATRISDEMAWIESIVGTQVVGNSVPEPGSVFISLMVCAWSMNRPHRRKKST